MTAQRCKYYRVAVQKCTIPLERARKASAVSPA